MECDIILNRKIHYLSESHSLRTLKDYFVEGQIRYIMDIMDARRYVYLNQIYETLGIPWNPNKQNPVFTGDRDALSVDIFVDDPKDRLIIHLETAK